MIRKHKTTKLLAITSFLIMLLVATLTNPVDRVMFSLILFVAMFIFLLNFGRLVVYARRGQVSPQNRNRILILSVFVVVLLMFRSSQSLNIVDALILVLVVGGLAFYTSRRTGG